LKDRIFNKDISAFADYKNIPNCSQFEVDLVEYYGAMFNVDSTSSGKGEFFVVTFDIEVLVV